MSDEDYPSEDVLTRIRSMDPAGALDCARAHWHWPDRVSETLRLEEATLLRAEPGDRYVRFATGGWSGNESIISALHGNRSVSVLCWQLSARGGLHIYRYPAP